jgi:hypothetical protein
MIRLFKTELIEPRGPWRSVEQVEIATLEYVDWFNTGACTVPGGHPARRARGRPLPSKSTPT